MPSSSPINRRVVIAIGLAIIGLILLLSVLRPRSSRIDTQQGEATIFFDLAPPVVALPGDCVTMLWRVEGIREVYVNDQPQTGAGQQNLCVDVGTTPTLHVKFLDDTEQDYVLTPTIAFASPVLWLGLISLVAAIFALRRPIFGISGRFLRYLYHSPTMRALPQRLALMAFGIALALLIVELGLRFYFTRYGTHEDQIKYIYSLEEVQEQNSILVPMPYVNYIPSPGFPEHNKLGYRGPEIVLPKPEGVFRIISLGGSTTYGSATKPEDSYPAQLQNILRDEHGYRNVEVINGGMVGYSSWETLASFAFRVLELDPDMVILYDNVNDIIPREQISVDCYRGHNALLGLNATKGFWVERDEPFSPSVLYRLIAIKLGWMPDPTALDSWFEPPRAECKLDDLSLDQRVANNLPVYFERNLRNTIALAQANQVQAVLSTWTYYLDQDRPDYWRKAVDENNAIIRQLADEMSVPIYDLAQNLPLDRALWSDDGIHMYAPGTHEQAREYANFLIEENLLPPATD